MADLGCVRTREVGDGACHLQRAVDGAGTPAQPGGGGVEELGGSRLQREVGVDLLALQRLVAGALALQGAVAGGAGAFADGIYAAAG